MYATLLSDYVVLGSFQAERLERFNWRYKLEVEEKWKGPQDLNKVEFIVEHHTCAKYRSAFDQLYSTQANGKTIGPIFYLKKSKEGLELLRAVPGDHDDLVSEKKFLNLKKK